MPLSFNFEGPEAKQERELRNKLIQLNIQKNDPQYQAQQLDQIAQTLKDPSATIGQKAVAYRLAGEYGGTREVEGLGNVPTIISNDEAKQAAAASLQQGAQSLAQLNSLISGYEQNGNIELANAYKALRDERYKTASKSIQELPIKNSEELVLQKNLISSAQKALDKANESSLRYGPLMGRVQSGLSTFYPENSKDYVDMYQNYNAAKNNYTRLLAGQNVSGQELNRMLLEIGDPTSNDFPYKLQNFVNQQKQTYSDKIQAWRQNGFKVPESLLKLSDESDSGQQATKQQAQQPGKSLTLNYVIDPSTGKLVPAK